MANACVSAMPPSIRSKAAVDLVCKCPETKQEATCLFCSHPAIDAYQLVRGQFAAICPKCHRRDSNRGYHFHEPCKDAVKKWCSAIRNGETSLESTTSILLNSTRALTRPPATTDDVAVHFSHIFDDPVRAMIDDRFPLELLERLPPEIQRFICNYLAPFPELVAVAHTERLLALVDKPSQIQPHVTCIEGIAPGKLLYLTFKDFRGIRYLSSISEEKGRPENSQLLRISGTSLIVSRDHFAIVDIYCADNTAFPPKYRETSAYYSTIDFGKCDSKGFACWAYSDGLFLRTLIAASEKAPASSHLIEWNTPSRPTQNNTVSFSIPLHELRLGAFRRRDYHDLKNTTGISAVVRNGKTVGIFSHRQDSDEHEFESFTIKLDRLFPKSKLIFMFFPIAHQEAIHAVGLRRLKDFRFPAYCPVIQVSTSRRRNFTFGPNVRAHSENIFDYETVWSKAGKAIEGLYHSPVSRNAPAFEEVGVSIPDGYVTSLGSNVCPTIDIPRPLIGAPDRDWCLSRVCVNDAATLQLCKAGATEDTCLGVLLMYASGCKESLGQIRFDKYLSEPIEVQDCYFHNQKINQMSYVSIRANSPPCMMELGQGWAEFPIHGHVSWWFGPNGNTISLG